MEYTESVHFRGDLNEVLRSAMEMLTPLGFRIVEQTSSSLLFQGPGMSSTKQSPLVGASQLYIRGDRSYLELSAELGGVRSMRKFLIALPLGLGILFFALGFVLPPIGNNRMWSMGLALLPVAPWLFLSPLMSGWIHRRTVEGLYGMLHNLAALHDD